jgi:uroporphyrin-3 C-methyltransferase
VNEAPRTDIPTAVVMSSPAEPASGRRSASNAAWLVAALVGIVALTSLWFAWKADQRIRRVEQELVQRQQDSAGQSSEARLFGKQALEGARDAAAKVALLEARVAEVAMQRTQLEELMQSLSRSRDENLLVDLEAAIRVALQQSAITGSAEPLVTTLKQSDERLARYNQPRLEGVRRAIARDLDRVKAASVADLATLAIKVDEAIRMVDELPLLASAPALRGDAGRAASRAAAPTSAAAAPWSAPAWFGHLNDASARFFSQAWDEVRSLVRVTRIDNPDAVLMAPDQAFFLRENLKLRLLNARLALLSRQFDTAQSDLQLAQTSLDRYFDRGSRRTALAVELMRQVAAQARQGGVPRPDDTLAALAAAEAGR